MRRDLARELGVSLQGLKAINSVYKKGMKKHLDREDFSASIKVVREMASARK